MNEPIFSVLTGKESAPLLLATFPNKRVVDSGPNNYWLAGDGYVDDNITDYNYSADAEVAFGVPGKYSTNALVTGYSSESSFYKTLIVRVAGPAGVGTKHLAAQMKSSSFTIEAWIKPTVALANKDPGYWYADEYFTFGPYSLRGFPGFDSSGLYYDPETSTGIDYIALEMGGQGTATQGTSSQTLLTVNIWNHVAIVRDTVASQLRVYLNGSLVITATDDPSFATSYLWDNVALKCGNSNANIMYYDQIRIMPEAIYSGSTITQPASGFSYTRSPAPAATTELLLNATHGLEDWGVRGGQVLARSGPVPPGFETQPVVSSDASKWGVASYRFGYIFEGSWYPGNAMRLRGNIPESFFGGAGDYLTGLLSVINNGPWTIEAWVRPMASISYSASPESYASTDGETYMTCSFWDSVITVYDNTISVPGAGQLNTPVTISAGTTLEFYHSFYDGNTWISNSYRVTAPTSLSRNQWHHIAVVADVANNLLRLKINGSEIGTINISQIWSNKGSASYNDLLYFGGTYDYSSNYPGLGFRGYIDDIRVSSAALYGTGSYAVPTGPLT